MSIASRTVRSVTTQPCTTQELRSVRYSVGEPLGSDPGSLATKTSSTVASKPSWRRAVLSCLPDLGHRSSCKYLQTSRDRLGYSRSVGPGRGRPDDPLKGRRPRPVTGLRERATRRGSGSAGGGGNRRL